MAETTSKQLVLEELRKVYEKQFSANSSLDDKLQNILNFLSVVVSVAPTLEVLVAPNPTDMSFLFVLLVLVVLVLYLVSFYIIRAGLSPVRYMQPIARTWEELSARYFDATPEQVTDLTISEYLRSMEIALEHNDYKIKAVERATGLMAAIVVILLFATPVNMFLAHPTVAEVLQLLSR
jgi:hypothetical protein